MFQNIRKLPIYRSNKSFNKELKPPSEDSARVIKLRCEPLCKYKTNKIVTSKYTIWNFLPKNLFEQFRRIGNFYFLCIAIISLVIESPVSPITNIAPLIFVITVTAIKQGYEDILRHKSDNEVNNAPITVIRKGVTEVIPAKNINVGDLVKIYRNQDIPCDLVLLISSHPESKCYVTTANLDGETNLKTLHCPKSMKRNFKEEADLNDLEMTIKCENPTPNLYKFHGRVEFGDKTSKYLRQSTLMRQQSLYEEMKNKRGETTSEDDDKSTDKSDSENQVKANKKESVDTGKAFRRKPRTKRTASFPKSATKTHKKTYSNIERTSFNLQDNEKIKVPKEWTYEEKASVLCQRGLPSLLDSNCPPLTTPDGNLVDPLSAENLLLRGSTLKITDFVFGCAVYTGAETKIALNSKLTSNKFSTVEKSINKYLLLYLGLLIAQVVISTIFKLAMETNNGYDTKIPFLTFNDNDEKITVVSVIEVIFSFIALYNCVIPISLYVTLELQKFIGTLFFEWDLKMYCKESDETAVCNTSDLNEDLGQIEYLFTDKTGTLTKNEMQFEKCCVNGIIYGEYNGKLYPILEESGEVNWEAPVDLKNCSREMELFVCALTLCHTVQATNGGENYNATSPDEIALVEAMKKLDVVFQDDADDMMAVKVLGQSKVFKKLDVLEFSSERKRMSVIIEDDEANIILYCKGAETSVIPQVTKGCKKVILKQVAEFAKQRLRTLVFGYKFLSRYQYQKITKRLRDARQTLSSEREFVVAETYRKIESNLTVLGATGIKDDIQEEVNETLTSLKKAGIKIWMLTGDKLETAENISLDCGHFEKDFKRLVLQEQKSASSCREMLQKFSNLIEDENYQQFGLIIDGESLAIALTYHREFFRDICMKCSAVIGSRMSPLQKKEVVKLIKDQEESPITAAIGDGANDVSMIQEAHVGIGIMGKEGRQAARCSDFAFSKFKYLKRTLLVHGHWYYLRVATLVQYFFYKNIAFVFPQFFFLFYSGYSIQSLYDSVYLTAYNTIFTSFPVLVYGLFEQNHKAELLESKPSLYLIHKRNRLMSWKNFLLWFSLGVWHSVIVFFFPLYYYRQNSCVMPEQRHMYLEAFGTLVFHCSVTVVNLKLLLHSRFWSGIFLGSILLSFLILVFVSVIYSLILVDNVTSNTYWVYLDLLESPTTYLIITLVCVTTLIPDFTIYAYTDFKNHNKKLTTWTTYL